MRAFIAERDIFEFDRALDSFDFDRAFVFFGRRIHDTEQIPRRGDTALDFFIHLGQLADRLGEIPSQAGSTKARTTTTQ